MASHALIDAYLARLAQTLPAEVVDELTDGLLETWEHRLALGIPADQAARAAIADFGTAERVTDEFVKQAPGRRTARLLLATGPIMAACWGTSLVAAKVWTWSIPPVAGAAYGIALLVVVASLLVAATSRHSYRRTRLGLAGALWLCVLDAAMIVAVAAVAPAIVWPMAVAIPASLVRIGFSIRSMPKRLAF